MNAREIVRSLVSARLLTLGEKFWDPELHPRVPGGTTKGGEFTFKRMGTTGPGDITRLSGVATTLLKPAGPVLGGIEPKLDPTVATSVSGHIVKLDPKTLDVGGDNWNRYVARRLEYEYKRTKPDLDKLVDSIVDKEKADISSSGDDEDEDLDANYTPESWDEMSNDLQTQAEEKWKENTYQDFLDSEIQNWYNSGDAYDTAATNLVDEFDKDKSTPYPPDWASDAIDEVIGWHEDKGKPIPYTKEQLLYAISVNFESGSGSSWSPPNVEFDDDQLGNPKGWIDNPTLPGIEPQKPGDFLTQDMRDDLEEVLTKAFVKKAENDSSSVDAPDYLSDSVSEYQDESWSSMDDHQKFKWTKNNTDLLDDDNTSSYSKPEPEIVNIKRPTKIDPLGTDEKYGSKGVDYKMTQALARKMSIKRAAQIMKERGIGGTEAEGWARTGEQIAREIDNKIWSDWKDSSTSTNGKILQLAIAQELHGRLNYKQLRDDVSWLIKQADEFPGGYEAIKAYLRAKWETTQWLLDNAGMQTLPLYRGLRGISDKEQGKYELVTSPTGTVHRKLPEMDLERNGAASTSANPKIANDWGSVVLRMEVPRTSVLSVPVYGQNVYGEQETVVTGTAFKGWDVWQSPAPTFDKVAIDD